MKIVVPKALTMVTKFAAISLIVPLILFVLAVILSFLPVKRITPDATLNFENIETAEDPSLDWGENWFPARDRRLLFYRELVGEYPRILIILHGSGSEGRYLMNLGEELREHLEVTVVLPDLRGHGRSMGQFPGDISYLGQLQDDVFDLYEHLAKKYPERKIELGGHSSGGGLAVRYGGSGLPGFSAYLLLAPYLGHDSPVVRPNSGGWVQVSGRRYAGLSILNAVGFSGLNYLPVLFFNRPEEVYDSLQVDSYSYRMNQSISPTDYRVELSRIGEPILTLVGGADEVLIAEEFERLFDEIAENSHTVIIAGVSHLDLVENSTAAIAIADWIKQLDSVPTR